MKKNKTIITKKIKDIIKKDKEVFLTTTRMNYPFIPESGENDIVRDVSGNKFIDLSSFISVYNFGINNTEIKRAIEKQVQKLVHPGFTDFYAEPPIKFGEALLKFFPKKFGKLFLSNSGTEANEAAIKFAKLFTDRSYIISFYNSFHGRTQGSLSMTSSKIVQREHFGPFANSVHVPFPYCYRCPFNQNDSKSCGFACIDYIKKYALSKEVSGKEVAGFFVEPIQGEGGYIVPPIDYFKELKKLLEEYGILLIDDEIQAGIMRTGKFIALHNFGVDADIYTFGKSIGGGIPMGVTVVKKGMNIPAGSHANTFGGNLLAVSAGEAMLNHIYKNKNFIEKEVKTKSELFMTRLKEMQEKYEIIGDVRGIGLMIGIEFVKSKKTKQPAIDLRNRILKQAFDNGLIMLGCGESTIRFIPAITIEKKNIEISLDIIEEIIKAEDKNRA